MHRLVCPFSLSRVLTGPRFQSWEFTVVSTEGRTTCVSAHESCKPGSGGVPGPYLFVEGRWSWRVSWLLLSVSDDPLYEFHKYSKVLSAGPPTRTLQRGGPVPSRVHTSRIVPVCLVSPTRPSGSRGWQVPRGTLVVDTLLVVTCSSKAKNETRLTVS